MSLLQEARERIRIQRAVEPATKDIFRERHEQRLKDLRTLVSIQSEQFGQAWMVEEEKRKDLQSEIRSECTALLVRHGVHLPDSEGSLNTAKSTWYKQARYLSTIIEEGEESILIYILSQSLQPERGDMIIRIQGLSTSLVLSPTRTAILCKNDGTSSWESASSMALGEYKDVVGLVKGKLQLPTPAQTPR